jgi:hypothetical protein
MIDRADERDWRLRHRAGTSYQPLLAHADGRVRVDLARRNEPQRATLDSDNQPGVAGTAQPFRTGRELEGKADCRFKKRNPTD